MRESRLETKIRQAEGITVVSCSGRIAYREEATALSASIMGLAPRPERVILDLTEVATIDSAGLGELVVLFMWGDAVGCQFKLAGANPYVREVLELTNLISVFEVYPTASQAMLSFHGRVA